MKKNYILNISLSILLLLILILGIYMSTFIQPNISFTAHINKISDKDYKRILNNKQVKFNNKNIDMFRHINVEIKVIEPLGITSHVNIERDYLHQYLENNNRVQILSGGRFEHGNRKEYAENMELYLKELSEYDLKTSLKDFQYKVTWKDLWGRQNQIIFYLKDYFK